MFLVYFKNIFANVISVGKVLAIPPSIHPPICPSIHLSFCPSTHPSFCLSTHPTNVHAATTTSGHCGGSLMGPRWGLAPWLLLPLTKYCQGGLPALNPASCLDPYPALPRSWHTHPLLGKLIPPHSLGLGCPGAPSLDSQKLWEGMAMPSLFPTASPAPCTMSGP